MKEIFYTLQGEGANVGRAAVFCRFSGCNLWSGREEDRASAICKFCDTDFFGTDGTFGGRYASAGELVQSIAALIPAGWDEPFVVCTGGEPAMQMDDEFVASLHARDFRVAIETNGTKALPDGIDWICVSPKAGAPLVQLRGNELKLVYPQANVDPQWFTDLDFDHFYLQPLDGGDRDLNTQLTIEYCLAHPEWRLSLQTHKITGMR